MDDTVGIPPGTVKVEELLRAARTARRVGGRRSDWLMTCPETITIGAYVLGALETSERRATEQHIETCAACREALLQIAHLPGLLHAVTLEDIERDTVRSTVSPTTR